MYRQWKCARDDIKNDAKDNSENDAKDDSENDARKRTIEFTSLIIIYFLTS